MGKNLADLKYSFTENWFSGKIENLAFPEEVGTESE